MAKAFAVAGVATAIVLMAGAHLAGGLEPDTAVPVTGGQPHITPAAVPAALAANVLSGHAVTGPAASYSEQPYELGELLRQSRLDEGWLVAHGFSSGAPLQRLHALLDARHDLAGEPRVLLNARPSGAKQGEGGDVPRLAAGERYVLATLESAPQTGDDSVLVRWRRTSDDTVMELSAQALPAAGERLQLWMHTAQDWAPGSYRLEVISANPRLEPLAAADFEVVAPGARVTAFSYPVQAGPQR